VIVNTGDDFRHLGMYICPDLDSVMYALAGVADPVRGWGRRDETWTFMAALKELGGENWFQLGDRDLAVHVERTWRLARGSTLSETTAHLCRALGIAVRVLPMSDDPVRTWIRTPAGWLAFQEYMIRRRAEGIVEGLEFRDAEQARPSAEALAAIESARAIVIGPSNPLASIAPILAVPGIREALLAASAPVVAVSPIVGGEVLKGPTAAFMAFAALECSADGVADFYGELLDGIVADENVARLPALQTDTRMDNAAARARLAERVLDFAAALAG
jgi:LPPG:FO 2-phospho-L-lactate transferase